MPLELFETHFHIGPGDSVQALTSSAREVGVTRFIAVAGNLEDAERLPGVAAAHDRLYCTAGVHPHDAEKYSGDINPFRRLLALPPTVAVGEIGLDYYYKFSDPSTQRRVFTEFLSLAREVRLPAVIHCRDAYEDCLEILRDFADADSRLEIHSFTGTPEWAEELLDLGAYFSFNGIATFQNAENVREALRIIPVDRLLLETDSPYLAPVPYRGQKNQPAYLVEVARKVAEVKEISLEELARVTTANAVSFFAVG